MATGRRRVSGWQAEYFMYEAAMVGYLPRRLGWVYPLGGKGRAREGEELGLRVLNCTVVPI